MEAVTRKYWIMKEIIENNVLANNGEKRTIACYEADNHLQLKPFAFMNIAQEIANASATSLGFGYNQFIQLELFWVLSRFRVIYLRPPVWQEEVRVKTWHKGENGLFMLRDFEVVGTKKGAEGCCTADGGKVAEGHFGDESACAQLGSPERLIIATSSWLIMHAPTRKLQRTDHVPGLKEAGYIDKHAIETPCQKIPNPPQELMSLWGIHTVLKSDVDMNGHTNNAKYMEWATDCLANILPADSIVSEFQINFNAETRLGDQVSLFTAQTASGVYYVEGQKEGRNVFQLEYKI